MNRLLYALPLLFLLSGCMTVLGYEPTPAELEMIQRGEDPRADEDERTAGESTVEGEGPTSSEPREERPIFEVGTEPGPTQGTVLRWVDSATVIIEASDKRETVALADQAKRESATDEHRVLERRMEQWTYGTPVRLTYPVRNEQGEPVYRNELGHLLATID